MDSNLYEAFPVKWSFGLLAVLCSERESRSSSRRLRSGSRSGRKGSRDRNGSIAWRLAASTLKGQTLEYLQQYFGKAGSYYYWPRAASTSDPFAPTEYVNLSAPKTRFPLICSPTKPRGTCFERSSTRYGAIASAPALAAVPSCSRSSSPTFRSSRAAAPVRCRSGRAASSNSSATLCSNLSFPS